MSSTASKPNSPSKEPLMARPTEDPFYTIRDEVRSLAENIKVRHEKFQDEVRNCDTSSNLSFKELRKGLVKDVRSVDKKLKGLRDAVDVIEKNRNKFAHISNAELSSRQKFVSDMSGLLSEVKSGMDSEFVRRKMDEDENKARRAGGTNRETLGFGMRSSEAAGAREKENDRFIQDQRQYVERGVKDQDQQLGALGSAVDRLGEMSRGVNQELREQQIMLDNLDSDLEQATSKMDVVMEALQKLLKTKDGCQIWTIVILTIILILLIALLIWT